MKKRIISALLVGILTAFAYQQAAMGMQPAAEVIGVMETARVYAVEQPEPLMLESMEEPETEKGKIVKSETGEDETTASENADDEIAAGAEPTEDEEVSDGAEPTEDEEVSDESEPTEDEEVSDESEPTEDKNALGESEPTEAEDAPAASETVKEDTVTAEPEAAEDAMDTAEPESEYANLAIAQVNNYVNVRREPGTDSEVVGKIYNGAVAQILDTAGEEQDWFHVVSGSVEGYIKAEFFLYGDAAVEAVDNYLTRYATVIADRLNVRQEPGTDSKRIGYITHGEKVKILEQTGDWLLVQYTEERTGYVAAEYATVSEEFIYAKSIEEERAEQEALREMARRMAQEEQAAAENTAALPVLPENPVVTPPVAVYTSNEELRSSVVAYALQYLGYPYVHGGRSLATGTDCSGFTCYIYADFGYSISRTPSGQYSSDGRSIAYSEIQPGDIICYGKSKCTHVGMYIGDGKIIHAANSRKGVVIYDADYDNILGVKSIID